MEKKKSAGKRRVAKGGERASALIERLRRSPVAYHALAIALTLTAIIAVSSLLMMFITRHGTHRTVPDFMGVKIAEAQRAAKKDRLEIIVNDSLFVPAYEGGIVLDQLPKGGAEVKAGRKIYVTINSFRQKMVKVPYVAGRSLRQAKNMLEVAGLGIERLVYETDIATNYVLAEYADDREIGQDSDVQIEMGSGVVLKVGVEPEKNTTIVPKAIGHTLQEAKSRLWEQGLNVGEVIFDDDVDLLDRKNARVYSQSVGHNAGARLGRSICVSRSTSPRLKRTANHRIEWPKIWPRSAYARSRLDSTRWREPIATIRCGLYSRVTLRAERYPTPTKTNSFNRRL